MSKKPFSIIRSVKRLKAKIVNKDKIYPKHLDKIKFKPIPSRDPMPPFELAFIKAKRALFGWVDSKVNMAIGKSVKTFVLFYGWIIVAGIGFLIYIFILRK